jgi:hypothetical protein
MRDSPYQPYAARNHTMGAEWIPLTYEKDFLEKTSGPYKLNLYIADVSYRGDDRMDVSPNGGYFIFAPPKALFFDYRLGKINKREFKKAYAAFLEESYYKDRNAWSNVLSTGRMVLVCSCNKEDKSCHRHTLIDFIKKLGGVYKGKLKSK